MYIFSIFYKVSNKCWDKLFLKVKVRIRLFWHTKRFLVSGTNV